MQHFSFLTLAFIGFGFSVISTAFVQRGEDFTPASHDFSVPEIEQSMTGTHFLDVSCAASEQCLSQTIRAQHYGPRIPFTSTSEHTR